MTKTILITGASTGIGYGAAKAFAAAGYRVIGTVRKMEDAERLKRELGANLYPVLCDVTQPEQVAQLPEHVKKISKNGWLDGLLNNAGICSSGPVEFFKMEEVRAEFETNVFGLMAVTQTLLPLLGTDEKAYSHAGRIINVSSIGGVVAMPFIAPYAATKHAVEGYSHGLRRELRLFGIKVILLGPGAIKTEIFNKDRRRENRCIGTIYESAFAKMTKLMESGERAGATPEAIGQFIRDIFETRNPKARYVFTRGKFMNWTLLYTLPHLWLDGVFGMMLGLKRQETDFRRSSIPTGV